jgi:hypothetical protein
MKQKLQLEVSMLFVQHSHLQLQAHQATEAVDAILRSALREAADAGEGPLAHGPHPTIRRLTSEI